MNDKHDTATRNTGQWEDWDPCPSQSFEYHSGYNQALRDTAASDMLEALRMVTWLEQGFTEDGRVMPSPATVMNAIEAAIAKATGGAA